LYCRSQDVFLGTPFNWGGYALLVHLAAQQCGLAPGELIWTGGDCHLYLNHIAQARAQLERAPYSLPELIIRRRPNSIFDYEPEDFVFQNYKHHPPIPAPIAV
jgi:thymidylate synthase